MEILELEGIRGDGEEVEEEEEADGADSGLTRAETDEPRRRASFEESAILTN